MNRWKLNISSRYSLGLAAVLVIFCMVVSTTATWARYRTEVGKNIKFTARSPVTVYLGEVASDEQTAEKTFVQTNGGSWELNEDGCLRLGFAIANGTSATQYEMRDQEVCIRVIGSLGIQSEEQPVSLKLTYPNADEPGTTRQVEAEAVRIAAGSPMYATFGDGWVFCFQADGEEVTWMLEGGSMDYLEMSLTMEDGTMADASLLQLQITSRYTKD